MPFNRYHRAFRTAMAHAPEEALPHFERALELNPKDPRALLQYGLALSESGRYAEAVEAVERAAELSPQSALPPLFLGMVRLEEGDLDAARNALEQAMERDGENALARNYAALVEWEAGEKNKAMEALLRIDFIQSSRFEAKLLVRVEEAFKSFSSPLCSMEEMERTGGFFLNQWVAKFEKWRAGRMAKRASALSRRGKHEAALDRLEKAQSLDPGNADIRAELGRARKRMVKELEPGFRAGRLSFHSGDIESAGKWLGQWLEEGKEQEQCYSAHGMLCEIELTRGDKKKASAHLKEVLDLDPHDLYAQYLEGRCALARGDRAAARRAFERFLDREPSFARYRLRELERKNQS